jgi:predicted nucleotidyltransferase
MEDTIVSIPNTHIPLPDVLFGRTRQKVLELLFGHPDESFYLREVARRTGQALGAVQRELAQLTAAGILNRERQGNQVRFRVNRHCPVYPELKALVTKTMGVADVLREALRPLADRIGLAFVFGSFVRGEQHRDSDVDVMVVGDVSFGEVCEALHPVEERLGREVNPTVYPPAEFFQKMNDGHYFIQRVLNDPVIFLIGGRDELGRLPQGGLGDGPPAGRPGH